ncbi:MAG: VOC family protein [Anaerolineaceae bacterium]|nr:VOC family protein [Anaerolineaceae bacterium]
MSKNPVVFWELASHDAEKSAAFFKKVFDWEIKLDENSGIYFIPAGEDSSKFDGGGIFTLRKSRLPFVSIYIQVEDIEKKVEQIKEAGGLIIEPPQSFVPGGTEICLFTEPSGVTFAMLQKPSKS